jgi:hypothetical protein
MAVYVDGAPVPPSVVEDTAGSYDAPGAGRSLVFLGLRHTDGALLPGVAGSMDDLVILRRALSPSQVREMYSGAYRTAWLNGVNLPWVDFGRDFRKGDPKGYSSAAFRAAFAAYASNGVNAVRLWVHCDAVSSPTLEWSGELLLTRGLQPGFTNHFDDMMALAAEHELSVLPCLWSFDMVEATEENGQPKEGDIAGRCRSLITDVTATQAYVDHALVPLLGVDGAVGLRAVRPRPGVLGDRRPAGADRRIAG